jgi:hypothetical protein
MRRPLTILYQSYEGRSLNASSSASSYPAHASNFLHRAANASFAASRLSAFPKLGPSSNGAVYQLVMLQKKQSSPAMDFGASAPVQTEGNPDVKLPTVSNRLGDVDLCSRQLKGLLRRRFTAEERPIACGVTASFACDCKHPPDIDTRVVETNTHTGRGDKAREDIVRS